MSIQKPKSSHASLGIGTWGIRGHNTYPVERKSPKARCLRIKQVLRRPTQAESLSDKDPSTASTNQFSGRVPRETEAWFETVEIRYVCWDWGLVAYASAECSAGSRRL